MTNKQMETLKLYYSHWELKELLDDLGWEYDRMTSSGQETLDNLWRLVGLPTFEDIENN